MKEEETLNVETLADLKRAIHRAVDFDEVKSQSFTFQKGMEFPKYKVTVEKIENDFFVDSLGNKWKRCND